MSRSANLQSAVEEVWSKSQDDFVFDVVTALRKHMHSVDWSGGNEMMVVWQSESIRPRKFEAAVRSGRLQKVGGDGGMGFFRAVE